MLGIGQVPLEVGSKIQGYEVIRTIGAGGFGIVYEGYNEVLDRKVAIKEFFPVGYATREDATKLLNVDGQHHAIFHKVLRKFRDTSGYLAKLDHPSIVKVHGYHDEPTTAYMLMDFVEGDTLRNWRLSKGESFSADDFRGVFGPVINALDYLHTQNMYHRDLSPENILVDENDIPTIIDFGAVKQELWDNRSNDQSGVASTLVVAREAYAPPEQMQLFSAPIGAYTDIFTLALVMYETLCNTRPPIAGERVGAKAMGAENPYVPVSNLSKIRLTTEEFQAIDKALELRPDERFPSIAAFANAAGWEKYLIDPDTEEPEIEEPEIEEPEIEEPEVEELESEEPEVEENASDFPVENDTEKRNAPTSILHPSWGKPPPEKPKQKSLLPYALIAASVGIGIIALVIMNSSEPIADHANNTGLSEKSIKGNCDSNKEFTAVKNSGDQNQLSNFLRFCREGNVYRAPAKALLKKWRARLQNQQSQLDDAVERTKYTIALNAGSNAIPLLEEYLKEYPNGGYSKLARHELNRLQVALNTQNAQNTETQAWQRVISNSTIGNIINYYNQFPNGAFVSNAENMLAKHAADFVNSVYQAASQSNGRALSFVRRAYADNVQFYGKNFSLDQIFQDKRRYFNRWPVRNYSAVSSQTYSNCNLSKKICEVTSTAHYEVYSPERDKSASGNQTTNFVIKMSNEGNKILAEFTQ